MTMTPQKLKVFLCHASENKPIVQGLYERLSTAGFDPWLDSHFLLPGMDWDMEIQKAMRSSDAVIVCLSQISVVKEGYVQKEIKYAREIQKEKPDGTIFLIPLQLEECEIPFSLRDVQWGQYFETDGFEKLVKALNLRAAQLKRNLGVLNAPTYKGLPPGSYIPFPRNALFTGRETDLEKLSALCEPNSSNVVISQAITGMGGIGKTQLAVEFAYRYGHNFKGVHWLDLHDPAQLETEIAKNGEKMVLQPWPDELPSQMVHTLNTWKSDGPRLIILDNFEDVGLANDVLAGFQHPNLRILLTSRRRDWPSNLGLKPVGLKIFTPTESLKFLRELLEKREDNQGDLENLAEHLGHLPLALELAGRYLEKHPRLAISDFLVQLEHVLEHRAMDNWKPDLKSATNHDLSLIQTFALSWEQIEDEIAQKAFIMAGYLAPNTAIPLEIFESSLECSPEVCDEALEDLFGLGLLRVLEDNAPAIHPLLAEFARRLDGENAELAKLSEKLAKIANKRNDEVDQSGDYSLFTPLIPHIRSVGEKAETAEIEQAGSLWNSLGYHIHDLADYAGAKAAYERAIKIGETAFGPDHPSVAIRVNNLGGVLQDLGDHAGAKAAFERAIKIGETAFGPDHPDVAIDVNNLGLVLQDLGDIKGAQAAYERALKIFKQFLPEGHPKIKIVEGNLRSLEEK